MNRSYVKKLALAGMLCAVAVAGSTFSFPVFSSKCAPVQHMVNVLCAVFMGPGYGLGVAFVASLLRGLMYKKTANLPATLCAEVFGTGIIGGLLSYPIAIAFMGVVAGTIGYTAYVVPFLVSTVGGSLIAGALVLALKSSGALKSMQSALEH